MIATKERKERKDQITDLGVACGHSWQKFSRGALLNGALWAVLLLGAWLIYPIDRQPHGFTALKVAALVAWGLGAFALAVRRGLAAWVGWPVALAGFLAAFLLAWRIFMGACCSVHRPASTREPCGVS